MLPPLSLIPRALQSPTSTSSSIGPPTATSSTVSSTSSSSNSDRSALIKSVVQWFLLTAAFVLIGIIIMRRVQHFRRTRRSFSTFFTSRTSSQTSTPDRLFPRTTGLRVPPGATPTLPPIALLSSHYSRPHQCPRHHALMAMDVDASGRRLGPRGLQSDHDGVLDDKDVLPAYDVSGGPPKYIELGVLGERTGSHGGVELESVGALGREGAEAETQLQHQPPGREDEATFPSTTSYPNAPPGGPASTSVDDVQDHPPPSSVHPDSETRRID